jgi:hypothetical protein
VVTNPKIAIRNIDNGTPRTFAQTLEYHGYENHTALAGTVIAHYGLRGLTPSSSEMLNLIRTNEQFEISTTKWHKKLTGIRLPAGKVTAMSVMFHELDSDMADEFMTALTLPIRELTQDYASDDPVLVARRVIAKRDSSNAPFNSKMRCAIVIKAWNHWRRSEVVTNIRWRNVGKKPEAYPEIA